MNGYNITNTKDAKTSVSGTKTWNDNNATDRLSSIQVDLLQNGNVIQTQEVTAANDWKYSFTNVESYDVNGSAYTYTVKERPVAGYKSETNGYDITNTKVGETKVEGTKTWKDDNAKDRPTMIKVDLLQNGKVITTKEVSVADEWKYAFTDLAAYDAEGNAYKYEVKEQPVNGYKSEVHGYDITNTKDPSTDPKDPSIDSKNPPTQENSKTSVWLPKTGGTSMDMISYIAGMLLLALGGFVFVRQRMR